MTAPDQVDQVNQENAALNEKMPCRNTPLPLSAGCEMTARHPAGSEA